MESDDKDFTNKLQSIEISQNLELQPDQGWWKPSIFLEMDPYRIKPRRRRRKVCGYRHREPLKMFTRHPREEYPSSDSDISQNTKTEFRKREITTIPEEVFHYKRHSKSLSAFKEKKNFQEKMASLTITVGRLKEMCLTKPEVLQDSVPEEIMKLMSSIQI